MVPVPAGRPVCTLHLAFWSVGVSPVIRPIFRPSCCPVVTAVIPSVLPTGVPSVGPEAVGSVVPTIVPSVVPTAVPPAGLTGFRIVCCTWLERPRSSSCCSRSSRGRSCCRSVVVSTCLILVPGILVSAVRVGASVNLQSHVLEFSHPRPILCQRQSSRDARLEHLDELGCSIRPL